MDSYMPLSFTGILRKSLIDFFTNKSLLASVISILVLLHSIVFSSNLLHIKPLIAMKEATLYLTSPLNSEYANFFFVVAVDSKIFDSEERLFLLATSFVLLFSSTVYILKSSKPELTLNELVPRLTKSCKRLAVTWFNITLFSVGYQFSAVSFILFLLKHSGRWTFSSPLAVALIILAAALNMYLSVVWNLALVVSVLEEKWGFGAIGEAGQLVEGMTIRGFLLNLVFGTCSIIMFKGRELISEKNSEFYVLFIGLIVLNILVAIKMFSLTAFTVFYHACKNRHEEEAEDIESQEGLEYYIKLPMAPLST